MQDPVGFLREAQQQEEALSGERQRAEQKLLLLRQEQNDLEVEARLAVARLMSSGDLPPKASEWSAQAREIAVMSRDEGYAQTIKRLGNVRVQAAHLEQVIERLRDLTVGLTTRLSYAKALLQGGG